MLNTMINSSVTMGQLQHKMDTIANNMANLDTAGFKRRDVSFNELLYQQFNNQPKEQSEIGRLTPLGIRQGVGAAVAQTKLIMQQGSIKQTDRTLDFAITSPNQFFQVTRDGETFLTREGKFYLSPAPTGPNGEEMNHLVTANGEAVLGKNGPIVLPVGVKEVVVSDTGEVTGVYANGQSVRLDQLDMLSVIRPQLLNAVGGNKFQLPNNLEELDLVEGDLIQVTPNGEISLKQGALESSNADITKEMTDLMTTQKSYQFNAQALKMANDMYGLINSLR